MPEKRALKTHTGWWFFTAVLCAYLLVGISDPQKALASLLLFSRMLGQVVPALGWVFLLLLLADLLLDRQRVKRHLGRQSGLKGWLTAMLAGVVAVGPIYGWYAFLADMRLKGMREALIATFLYSRALKLPLLPLMLHYFGTAYTIALSVCILLFSLLNGLLLERLVPVTQARD